MSAVQATAWPSQGAPSSASSSSSPSSPHAQAPAQTQEPAATVPQGRGQQPWSLLSALSISMYQSLSFSRSPSFERTRYIASTCTFIAIIYLRTLHCLFFGTGALSCAVLAKCLKHTIRQPRPPQPTDLSLDEYMDSTDTYGHATDHITPNAMQAASSTTTVEQYTKTTTMDPIPRPISPTLSLAPATGLQQEQVNASNEPKVRMAHQRLRKQRRRRLNLRIDYGMPSSHAQLVAFFVCYISLQLVLMEPEGSAGQWFLILLLQLYAWSVVWSRIRLGRHSVSQVLVGAAIGAVYGMVWFTIWVWRVEEMIKHWQWMDRYGVIQVRNIWKQLEMDEAAAIGRAGGWMYPRHGHYHQQNQYLRL
ncbi:dolichyldiphosphatase [Entomortierella parvispora]|uniref:Dolichyldiphosphatase n=1 Tax=Entomortierella parvispora TaxID=205924 RepID=A0A9P3H2J6_9FUNG|nr:dolichyldiphosphatase [Entomortierella parvispora]